MATKDFQYLPLDTQIPTLRLLRLLKSDSVKIECEIFHSPISSSNITVSYEALSYTWGCTDLVDYIEVNGRRLWITANLYSALLCLRSRDNDRILWIDAICIDQSNKVEQSQQVRMMGSIFGFAERVIFWLEKPTPEAMLLMEFLSELQTRGITFLDDSSKLDDTTLGKLWSQVKLEPQNSDLLSQLRKGLFLLLSRPWFERVWILQEVANAQSAVVCSGALSVSASIFAQSPSLLDIRPSPHIRSILDIMPHASRHDSWWSRERELSELLDRFRACKATDKRDMIFALLGMSSDPDHPLLRPDYTRTIDEVLHNAVRYWFESTDVPISHVIHLLAAFENVRVTYLVLPEEMAIPREVVQIPSRSETVECIRDASLLVLEQCKDVTGGQDTFHDELDRLEAAITAGDGRYSRALRIVPWQNSLQNVKLLVVGYAEVALLKSINMQTIHVFDFIFEKGFSNDRNVLNRTLLQSVSGSHDWNENGFEYTLDLLIERGADVDAQGGKYGNALHAASAEGHVKRVQILLDRGADVNAYGGQCGTALHAASVDGHDKVVQMLLDKGANVNAQGGFCGHALHAASRYNHDRIVRMLLDKGANVNAHGGRFGTALQAASYRGHDRIVQILLERGADVNAHRGEYGTALHIASLRGFDKVVQLLQNHLAAEAPAQRLDKSGSFLRAPFLTVRSWFGDDAPSEKINKSKMGMQSL